MLACLLLGNACSALNQVRGSPSPSPSPTLLTLAKLTVSADMCALEAGAPFAAGRITFLAINKTNVTVSFAVFILASGHTFSEVRDHMEEERRLADAGKPFLGPPDYLSQYSEFSLRPAETGTPEITLPRGTYVIVCLPFHPLAREPRAVGAVGPLDVR
ncbi:MAG: hypothetical protein M3T56_12960 [Chloroflexota bacterium]|nr:hypothetical protein [Chloroflexota bacterium]